MIIGILAISATMSMCPGNIRDKQSIVAQGDQWLVNVQDFPRKLDEVEVVQGDPFSFGTIMGVSTRTGMRWEIASGDLWIRCAYQRSAVRLARKIDAPAVCVFTKGDPIRAVEPKITCEKVRAKPSPSIR